MKRTLAMLVMSGLALTSSGWAATPAEGELWDYAMTVDMQGMKMALPPTEACVRPAEGNTPPVEKNCTLKERTFNGASTTFRIVCGPPEPSELKGTFTRKGDSVEGRYTIRQGGEVMTVVAKGHKQGACDPSRPMLRQGKK